MFLRRLQYQRTTGLILRRTFQELQKSHIIKLFEEYPEARAWYNSQNHQITFPNGSILFFGHGQDISGYFSAEFADIMVDEAQEFSQYELEQLGGSNRCTSNIDIVSKTIYSFMPGQSEAGLPPIGLSYLKRVFVDALQKPSLLTLEERKHKWAFVQAFSWDNIEWFRKALAQDKIGEGTHRPGDADCGCQECVFYSWPESDRREYFLERTEFGRQLSAITRKDLRLAWLFGRWDVFEGQYFNNFQPDKHIISREEFRRRVKPWHRRWVSGDWGWDHPHDVQWHVIDELGRIITYRETWDRMVGEAELGKKIGELNAGEKMVAFPFSWDAGKLSKRSHPKFPKSIEQMIREALPKGFPNPVPSDSSPASRIARARLVHGLLDAEVGGIPKWQIVGEDCPHLVACLPTLLKDPDNPEDVLKVDFSENQIGDDPYDCSAIGLQYMIRTMDKPDEQKIAEKLEKITNPMQRHIEHRKMEAEFKKKRQPLVRHGDWRSRLEDM